MGKDQSLKPFPLILASTSRYRQALLSQTGWTFEAFSPDVDESVFKSSGLSPHELALTLAKLKAKAIFDKHPTACVIGSDQVCSLGSTILSKPGNREVAHAQLQSMQGKSHELLTAVTLIYPGGEKSFINKTTLHMRRLLSEEIGRYLDHDLPFDCAGSYKLESRGITLFEKIEMDDHTSIIGLPLIQLTNHLLAIGFTL
jgi:septum formation protein